MENTFAKPNGHTSYIFKILLICSSKDNIFNSAAVIRIQLVKVSVV